MSPLVRRIAFGTVMSSLALAGLARAQEVSPQPEAAAAVPPQTPSASLRNIDLQRSRPSVVMQSTYAATIAVQAFDGYATFKALDVGARQGNPLLRPLAERRPAFVAFKAGIAAAAIYFGHDMSKRSKVKAVLTLAGINAIYAGFAIHNYHMANSAPAH